MCILWLIALPAILILLSPLVALIYGIDAASKAMRKNATLKKTDRAKTSDEPFDETTLSDEK